MILFFEREAAAAHRDWLARCAKSPDPIAAKAFQQQADRLTREIADCDKRNPTNAIHA